MAEKKERWYDKWAPTLIVASVVLVVMTLNRIFWNVTWLYTLTMIGGTLLGALYALWWARRKGQTFALVFFNLIVMVFLIMTISFFFMVLPELLSPAPVPRGGALVEL